MKKKMAVLGANGTLGRALVECANARGHALIAVTRGAPKRAFMKAILRSANVETGEGLDDALRGVEVVFNAVNARQNADKVLVDGTRRLLEAAKKAGVSHYVAISIVGIDRVPMRYYEMKLREEEVIKSQKDVPWSLLRTTQFHSFLDDMFTRWSPFGVLPAVTGATMQPVDVHEVASALVDAAEAEPANEPLPDMGGPEVSLVRDLAKQWLAATKKTRLIVPSPAIGQLGKTFRDGALCCPDRAIGKKTFREWLSDRYG